VKAESSFNDRGMALDITWIIFADALQDTLSTDGDIPRTNLQYHTLLG
jgi:hypothetical protein